MDDQLRTLQRQYASSGDPEVFQRLLLAASRSGVFSQSYTLYLASLGIEPFAILAPPGVNEDLAAWQLKELTTMYHLLGGTHADAAPIQLPEVLRLKYRAQKDFFKKALTTVNKEKLGKNTYHSYQRLILILNQVSEIGLKCVEDHQTVFTDENEYLQCLDTVRRFRDLFQQLAKYGPNNIPDHVQMRNQLSWAEDILDHYQNLGWSGEDISTSFESICSLFTEIAHQYSHILGLFLHATSMWFTCNPCEERITWGQLFDEIPKMTTTHFWMEVMTDPRVVRGFDWKAFGIPSPKVHSKTKDPLRRPSLILSQANRARAMHLMNSVDGVILIQMAKKAELAIIEEGMGQFSPGQLWN